MTEMGLHASCDLELLYFNQEQQAKRSFDKKIFFQFDQLEFASYKMMFNLKHLK